MSVCPCSTSGTCPVISRTHQSESIAVPTTIWNAATSFIRLPPVEASMAVTGRWVAGEKGLFGWSVRSHDGEVQTLGQFMQGGPAREGVAGGVERR